MANAIEVLRWIHIGAGFLALAAFFVPVAARKGGRLHRRAGWVYVGAMAVVAVTALAVSALRWAFEPRFRPAAIFLSYLAVLSATSASEGMRVLRAKQRNGAHRHAWDLGLPSLLLLCSVGVGLYGLRIGVALFSAFSVIGLIVGGGQLAYWLRRPASPMHWWYEHMGSMLGAGIATLTAFVVTNAPRLGLSQTSLVAWLAPAVVGTAVIALWTRHYRRRFESGSERRGAHAAA